MSENVTIPAELRAFDMTWTERLTGSDRQWAQDRLDSVTSTVPGGLSRGDRVVIDNGIEGDDCGTVIGGFSNPGYVAVLLDSREFPVPIADCKLDEVKKA